MDPAPAVSEDNRITQNRNKQQILQQYYWAVGVSDVNMMKDIKKYEG